MGSNRSHFRGENLPVEKVSWKEAVAFCKKISNKQGRTYRLPTEAEWEYACRAGATGAFSGTGNIDDMAWYEANSEEQTHPVTTKKANAWGLYDMHGNVSEWCSDRYKPDYPEVVIADPTGPTEGKYRVVRGGSWGYFARSCQRFWETSNSFEKYGKTSMPLATCTSGSVCSRFDLFSVVLRRMKLLRKSG